MDDIMIDAFVDELEKIAATPGLLRALSKLPSTHPLARAAKKGFSAAGKPVGQVPTVDVSRHFLKPVPGQELMEALRSAKAGKVVKVTG
jgi:hypothetical protein